jgi:putative DNA primase/helicase
MATKEMAKGRDAIDFAALCEPVARRLWGEPNPALTKGLDLRWGTQGSRSLDVRRGVWFDHEAGTGGGTIDLICREHNCDKTAALHWIKQEGLAAATAGTQNNIQPSELSDAGGAEPARQASPRTLKETYPYVDETGALLFEVVRYEPKDFRQRRPDGAGGWIWNLDGVRRVLYRLRHVLEAVAAKRLVFVVEGEKDVGALVAIGACATTCPGGANKWLPEHTETLRGARVVIISDNDDAGRKQVPMSRQLSMVWRPKCASSIWSSIGQPARSKAT